MAEKMNMRTEMPVSAAWIDGIREAFGADYINGIMRRGMRGEPVFSASENGHTIGTPVYRGVRMGHDEQGNSINLDNPGAAKEPRRVCNVAWLPSIDQAKE